MGLYNVKNGFGASKTKKAASELTNKPTLVDLSGQATLRVGFVQLLPFAAQNSQKKNRLMNKGYIRKGICTFNKQKSSNYFFAYKGLGDGLPLKRTRAELFFFYFARLLQLNRKTRHSLRRLKGRPETRAANHFKEEFLNLYKIVRLRFTPQHQDKDAPGLASIGCQNRHRLRRTGLLRLREDTMKQRSAGCLKHGVGW